MTPAEQVANELAVCGDEGVVRTTPAEVLATLTGQAPAPDVIAAVREQLDRGQPIAAIKAYRAATGATLIDSKAWVDAYYQREYPDGPPLAALITAGRRGKPVVPPAEQSPAARLAAALEDWDNGRSGMVAAGAVIDAARALLADHERLMVHRAEAIDALTAERDRLARDLATEWILTGEVAAVAYGRAVIAKLDGHDEPAGDVLDGGEQS